MTISEAKEIVKNGGWAVMLWDERELLGGRFAKVDPGGQLYMGTMYRIELYDNPGKIYKNHILASVGNCASYELIKLTSRKNCLKDLKLEAIFRQL